MVGTTLFKEGHVGSPGINRSESKSVGDVADGLELSVGIDVLPSTV